MSNIDVSIVVTFHQEAKFVARTLASLSEAATFARDHGVTVELIAVLDRADVTTKDVYQAADLAGFTGVRRLDIDCGSPSMARNTGVFVADGEYVCTADGDDLVSYSSIVRMLTEARRRGEWAIVVPRFYFGFGTTYHIVEYFNQERILSSTIIQKNIYNSKIMFHRSLITRVPKLYTRLESGYAYEDWHINCEAIAAGYRFYAADKTILFYRQRRGSVRRQHDRETTRQIPPSRLFTPAVYLRAFAETVERFRFNSDFVEANSTVGLELFQDPDVLSSISRANAIDPAVEMGRYHWNSLGIFDNMYAAPVAVAYYTLCELVGNAAFDEVVFLPDAPSEPEAKRLIDAIAQQVHLSATKRVLALAEYPGPAFDMLEQLASVTLIDLGSLAADLSAEDHDLMCLKLIQSCAPDATIRLSFSGSGRRFVGRYGIILRTNPITFYRRSAMAHSADQLSPADVAEFEFVDQNVDVLDRIICPDTETIAFDCGRLRYQEHKWLLDNAS